jgi:hypothetical protein
VLREKTTSVSHPRSQAAHHPAYLDEADILALLTEALSADVEAVFSDKTGFVGADAAVGWWTGIIGLALKIRYLKQEGAGERSGD